MISFLSHPLSINTPLYGGVGKISAEPLKSIQAGDSCNSFLLSFPNHSSTHVDCPKHFIANGKQILDFTAKDWIFINPGFLEFPSTKNQIIDFNPCDFTLGTAADQLDFLIIKTRFETYRGQEEYWKNGPGISHKLANRLKTYFPNLRGIGIDFISVSSFSDRTEGRLAHFALLSQDILIVEDMKLSSLFQAPTKLVVSPLLFENLDGAPVTVFAWSDA